VVVRARERSILNLALAIMRAYQTHLKVFCDFLTDPFMNGTGSAPRASTAPPPRSSTN
jgi:hypothetical protein